MKKLIGLLVLLTAFNGYAEGDDGQRAGVTDNDTRSNGVLEIKETDNLRDGILNVIDSYSGSQNLYHYSIQHIKGGNTYSKQLDYDRLMHEFKRAWAHSLALDEGKCKTVSSEDQTVLSCITYRAVSKQVRMPGQPYQGVGDFVSDIGNKLYNTLTPDKRKEDIIRVHIDNKTNQIKKLSIAPY